MFVWTCAVHRVVSASYSTWVDVGHITLHYKYGWIHKRNESERRRGIKSCKSLSSSGTSVEFCSSSGGEHSGQNSTHTHTHISVVDAWINNCQPRTSCYFLVSIYFFTNFDLLIYIPRGLATTKIAAIVVFKYNFTCTMLSEHVMISLFINMPLV